MNEWLIGLLRQSVKPIVPGIVWNMLVRAYCATVVICTSIGQCFPHPEESLSAYSHRLLLVMKTIGYRFFKKVGYQLWQRISARKRMLGGSGVEPLLLGWCRRCLVRGVQDFFDWYYRRSLLRLNVQKQRFEQIKLADRKHKLLLAIGSLGPGGAERQLVISTLGLVNSGMSDLRVLCHSLDSANKCFFMPELEKQGVLVEDLSQAFEASDSSTIKLSEEIVNLLPGSLHDVAAYFISLHSDPPLVAHFWLDDVNIKGGIAAVLLGIPRVILGLRSLSPDNFHLHQPYMREAYRWLANQPNVSLINNSKAGAQSYETWLDLPPGTIQVIHNGFEWSDSYIDQLYQSSQVYKAQHGINSSQFVVGTVIRLSEEKRPFMWLEIAAHVRRKVPNTCFLIVGDGPLRSALEARAASPDLFGAVRFIGHEKNVMAAMVSMDLFLLSSRAEGLPNVLIEAQIVGVPVVTTKVGGAPETVQHGVTGWVLDSDDCEAAAELVSQLLLDSDWRNRARGNMKRFINDAFGVQRMIDSTLGIYGMHTYRIQGKEVCNNEQ